MLEIEFYHDVICSFCFPMSNRMRKVLDKYNNIKLVHRSFALAWEVSDLERMFGSHEAAKGEVINHWQVANQNDDDHRFNIEGMKQTDFNFPHSQKGLIAAKAAGMLAGQEVYWEVFDKIQEGLFVRNLNIADDQVIADLVKETSVDFEAWQKQAQKVETKEEVLADLRHGAELGIQAAPSLVIDNKYLVSGAQPQELIEQAIEQAAKEAGVDISKPAKPSLQMMDNLNGLSCRVENGQWICD